MTGKTPSKKVKIKKDKIDIIEKYENFSKSYKTVKCGLKKIIGTHADFITINHAISNVNKIVIHTYNFLKLYYLDKYHNKQPLPIINEGLIKCIMKTLCIKDLRGVKPNESNQLLINKLKDFYDNHYKKLMKDEKLTSTYLDNVLSYEAISIVTNFKNHIENHFYNFFNRYINMVMSKKDHEDSIKQYYKLLTKTNKNDKFINKKKQEKCIKNYNSNIRKFKKDLYTGTDKCPSFLNPIKNKIRNNIFNHFGYNNSLYELSKSDILSIAKSYSSKILCNNKELKDILNENLKINKIKCTPIKSYTLLCKEEEIKIKIADNYKQKLDIIKDDIINKENNCPSYLIDIKNNIKNSMEYKETLKNILMKDSLKLLPYMIQMSIEIEKQMGYTFNCFHLRTNIRPKYITLDTATIIQLLFDKNEQKSMYLTNGNTKLYENDIWRTFFNIEKKMFRKKNYVFNHQIETDGYGCSILLIRKDLYNSEKKTKIWTVSKPQNYKSDKYVDELTDEEKKKYKNYTLVGIDPNKGDLIYATDGTCRESTSKKRKAHIFRYSNIQRKKEIKSKEFLRILEKDKQKTKIEINEEEGIFKTVKELESELCLNEAKTLTPQNILNYNKKKNLIDDKLYNELKKFYNENRYIQPSVGNSKTCIYENALNYIKKKNEINSYLYEYYEKMLHRQLHWYGYINKQKSESKMINNFRKTFGDSDKVLICFGDWSQNKPMKYQEPTKGKSLRKLFTDAGYNLCHVNEYNTSKMNLELNCEMENFHKIKSPKPYGLKRQKLCHGLVRAKTILTDDPIRHRLMNRDLNASLNIRYKAECIIFKKKLPECFIYKKKKKN